MRKDAIILSGGMDSATLFFELVFDNSEQKSDEIHCITFDYGQRHRKEILAAKHLFSHALKIKRDDLKIYRNVFPIEILGMIANNSSQTNKKIDVPEGHYEEENMKKTVVPNRNMVMLSIAASYCFARDIKHLYYGAHAGDHAIYPDCRPQFVDAMQDVLNLADWNQLKLHVPYMHIDKGTIAKLGKEIGVPYELTWTCYKGLDMACGKCGACQERLEAFKTAEMEDPIDYMELTV